MQCCHKLLKMVGKNHFFKMKGGYRDGLKYQKGRNKGSLHSKVAQSYMTPSLYLCFIVYKGSFISNKDIGMASCSFVQLCCVMTPCFFLFGASSHPFHFEEMIFPLVLEYEHVAKVYTECFLPHIDAMMILSTATTSNCPFWVTTLLANNDHGYSWLRVIIICQCSVFMPQLLLQFGEL